MPAYEPGRVLHRFSYKPTSLAANTTETILDSDDIRNKIAGKVVHLRWCMRGGGHRKTVATSSGFDYPAAVSLTEYSDKTSSFGFKQSWPCPGDAVGRFITPIYSNYMPSSVGDAGGWIMQIRNSASAAAKQATTNCTAIELWGEVVEGPATPFEQVSLQVHEKRTTIANDSLFSASWRRCGGGISAASEAAVVMASIPNGGYTANLSMAVWFAPYDVGFDVPEGTGGSKPTTASGGTIHGFAAQATNTTVDYRPQGTSGWSTLLGSCTGIETDYEYTVTAEATWSGGL